MLRKTQKLAFLYYSLAKLIYKKCHVSAFRKRTYVLRGFLEYLLRYLLKIFFICEISSN
jgi:hypothetical protein